MSLSINSSFRVELRTLIVLGLTDCIEVILA